MEKELPPEAREIGSNLSVEPAEGFSGVKNCVVIENIQGLQASDIARFAVENEAYVDNSDDEAGDDEYLVRFPGQPQELLMDDGLFGRLREDIE